MELLKLRRFFCGSVYFYVVLTMLLHLEERFLQTAKTVLSECL